MTHRFFASDNCSGIHPKLLSAIQEANEGHVKGYGYDKYTQEAEHAFKDIFGSETEVFFVYSGTGANVLGLESCIRSFEAVLCSDVAHIQTDEAGAPERFLQSKLITIPSFQGKIKVDQIPEFLNGRGVEHHVQPKVISITQSTEYGTLYLPDEVSAISEIAKRENLFMHMDGARISNATAVLGNVKSFTKDAGIDVMSFGGTKNGMLLGEAVVFFNKDLAKVFKYQRKQAMQLASKMRFISTQFTAFLKDDLWLEIAKVSNEMAAYFKTELNKIPEIILTQPVDVNAIFAIFPPGIAEKLQENSPFYFWNEETKEVRFMCSWDTEKSDIDFFIKQLKELLINKIDL